MWKQHFPSPSKKTSWTRRQKRCDVHFVHGSPVNYHMFYLSTEQPKMHETALPMVCMFHTSLVIHGRSKFILFRRGQTSSSSAMKMELRLIKQIQKKTKNTVKHSVKTTFSITMPKKRFVDAKMKKMWCSFRPWFSSELWHFVLINKNSKHAWNRNSNGKNVAHIFGHPWKM